MRLVVQRVTRASVSVDGEVVGDIHAGERIELTEHARVQGNVHYSVVEMSAGAQLNGRLVHAASLPLAALAALQRG